MKEIKILDVVFGNEWTESMFQEFASSFVAYDENENEVWAPTDPEGFKEFCEEYFSGSCERANFKEGVDWFLESYVG